MGGKMSPTAMLVISNGTTKLVSVKNQDSIGKILDMVPDMVNKFTGKNSSDLEETLKDLESETE